MKLSQAERSAGSERLAHRDESTDDTQTEEEKEEELV